MAKSLNRVQLIGNLTRDPELRYTPNGTAVCSFGLATNRSWTTDNGEKHEEAEFHRIVAWNKLAELCSQFLVKGRKVYVEGRLSTRNWTAQDGTQRSTTEVVIDDMILLDSRRSGEEQTTPVKVKAGEESVNKVNKESEGEEKVSASDAVSKKERKIKQDLKEAPQSEDVTPDDIPF